MKIRILLLLLMTVMFSSLFAQTAEIDSLRAVVGKAVGTEKVDAMNRLSKVYWLEYPELSIENGNKKEYFIDANLIEVWLMQQAYSKGYM